MPLIIPSNTITGGYEVDNSLRFDDGSSDYLNRTPASASNRKTWTWSGWIKRSTLGNWQHILSSGTDVNTRTYIAFEGSSVDKLRINSINAGTPQFYITTNQVFRDTSAWYHIVVAVDTTQASQSDRVKVYVNGSLIDTTLTTGSLSQNIDTSINNSIEHKIGTSAINTEYFDGYMSEVVFIDGQQLDATSFGEFDADSGIWKPIDVSGLTFGTNGFYLEFKDSSALGDDTSGNSNDFTVNNLTSDDQMIDTPTNNFCVLNSAEGDINRSSVSAAAAADLSEGNLQAEADIAAGNYSNTRGTIGIQIGDTNKYYFENTIKTFNSGSNLTIINFGLAGDPNMAQNTHGREDNLIWFYRPTLAQRIYNETTIVRSDTGVRFVANDVLQVAYDAGTGKMWFGKNNNWLDATSGTTGDPSAGTNPTLTSTVDKTLFPVIGGYSTTGGTAHVQEINFGQTAFAYTPPSGFVSLNTKNLAEG